MVACEREAACAVAGTGEADASCNDLSIRLERESIGDVGDRTERGDDFPANAESLVKCAVRIVARKRIVLSPDVFPGHAGDDELAVRL